MLFNLTEPDQNKPLKGQADDDKKAVVDILKHEAPELDFNVPSQSELDVFSPRIIEWKRNDHHIVVGLLTRACRLRNHLRKLGLEQTTHCRFCYVEDETAVHILCSCLVM
nr:unnamed protein product [Callosobruchus analis]